MELKKQITSIQLQEEFQPLVDEFVDLSETLFPGVVHSIYICGSVPKGQAIPYVSDVDFTIVFKDVVESYYIETIQHMKSVLLRKYPVASKVDIAICTVQDVLHKPNEWGFWIKIISVCIHGNDLGFILDPIVPGKELIEGLNKETMHVIKRIIDKLRFDETEEDKAFHRRALTKRLIRAMYTLILDKVGYWTDDFTEIRDLLYEHFPDEEQRIRALYFFLENEASSMEEYLSTVYGIMKFIQERLENL